MTVPDVAFGIIAAAMVLATIGVVTVRNVVHAALYLVIVLAGVAAQYILLTAEFVAWVQVLIYIGAIIVLFLFGIMLTRAPMSNDPNLDNPPGVRLPALVVAIFLLGVLASLLGDAFGRTELEGITPTTTATVGDAIFQNYVIPFEVVSMLLLAALIGAVVIAKRD